MREGDLLILASDGVFDNLFEDEILQIVKNFTKINSAKTKITAAELAKEIADAAQLKSK